MPRYEFTDQAEYDLETITDYTLEQWGQAQLNKYLDGLEALVQTLSERPALGLNRDSLFEGLISFPYGSHILYYVTQPHGITVIRVLHKRMDPKRYITPPIKSLSSGNPYGQKFRFNGVIDKSLFHW